MMHLYIWEVVPEKKEMTVVISERFLMNLVPLDIKLLKILREIFPEYRIYKIHEKYFEDAPNWKDKIDQSL